MKKYYLTFGCLSNNKAQMAELLSEELGISFHLSSGDSYAYRFGTIAETISIFTNYSEEDEYWQYDDFQNCPVIVTASFTLGKNTERKEKATFVRKVLLSIPNLVEIEYSVFDRKTDER